MKKNKIFANRIDKKINNNQKIYDIKEEKETYEVFNNYEENDNLTVKEKLEKIFQRNGYVFNVNVRIITDKKSYDTKIAGKVNNFLITLDNDIININDVKDIIIKN